MNAPVRAHEWTLGAQLRRAAAFGNVVRFLDRRERAETLDYATLWRRARRFGGGLRRLGVRRGDRVAIVLPTGPAFYDAFFGAVLAGAVPVPLYPPVRLGRMDEYHRKTAAMVDAVQAAVLLSDRRIRRLLGTVVARSRPRLGCVAMEALPADEVEPVWVDPDELAFIQLSSGTTVAPKPVALTHRQVQANVGRILGAILDNYPETDRPYHAGVSWLPLYHDMGLVGCVLVALAHPGDLTLIPPELFVARPAVWLRALSRYRGTISPAPNFAYALCADRIADHEIEGVDLSSWRFALNGAEPVTPTVLRRFVDRFAPYGLRPEALTPVYGLAEAALAVTFSTVTAPFFCETFDSDALTAQRRAEPASHGQELVCLGRPLPGFEIQIRPRDGVGEKFGLDGNAPLPDGEVGRLWIRGPSVMRDYFNRPDLTEAALDAKSWLDTGDLGFVHHGQLYLCGRHKEIIILAGRNHAPQEIEQTLDDLDGVRTGCAVALGVIPPGGDAEQLVVLVERAKDAQQDDAALADAVAQRISERTGLRAAEVKVLAPGTLPRTSSGKLRRAEALRQVQHNELAPPRSVTPVLLAGEMAKSSFNFARAKITRSRS